MEGFEGLTSAFNVSGDDDFKKSIVEVKKDMELIEAKKNSLVKKVESKSVFQDQDFIQSELRSLIMSARTVMYKVEQDIKIGVDSRKIEVYAKLVEAIGKQYQSLIELNKSIFEAKVQTGQVDITNIGNNKISLTSEQIVDMIDDARKNSQMNAIETEFEIDDEHISNNYSK